MLRHRRRLAWLVLCQCLSLLGCGISRYRRWKMIYSHYLDHPPRLRYHRKCRQVGSIFSGQSGGWILSDKKRKRISVLPDFLNVWQSRASSVHRFSSESPSFADELYTGPELAWSLTPSWLRSRRSPNPGMSFPLHDLEIVAQTGFLPGLQALSLTRGIRHLRSSYPFLSGSSGLWPPFLSASFEGFLFLACMSWEMWWRTDYRREDRHSVWSGQSPHSSWLSNLISRRRDRSFSTFPAWIFSFHRFSRWSSSWRGRQPRFSEECRSRTPQSLR